MPSPPLHTRDCSLAFWVTRLGQRWRKSPQLFSKPFSVRTCSFSAVAVPARPGANVPLFTVHLIVFDVGYPGTLLGIVVVGMAMEILDVRLLSVKFYSFSCQFFRPVYLCPHPFLPCSLLTLGAFSVPLSLSRSELGSTKDKGTSSFFRFPRFLIFFLFFIFQDFTDAPESWYPMVQYKRGTLILRWSHHSSTTC